MKEEILAQLREESAAQLEEHKHLLEQEYQKRLDSFMSQFKPVDGSPNLKDGSSSSSASKARVTARVEDSSIAARHIIKLVSGGKGARIMTPKELAPAAAAASAAAAEEGCSNTKKAKLVADVLPERTVKVTLLVTLPYLLLLLSTDLLTFPTSRMTDLHHESFWAAGGGRGPATQQEPGSRPH